MYSRSRNWLAYLVFALIAIGLFARLLYNPGGILIPVIIFGLIFLLYKYPPSSWRSSSGGARRPGSPKHGRPKSRRARFRVIPGNKRDDDDEPPRYH